MNRTKLAVVSCLVLVIICNIVALLRVYNNRSGEPLAQLLLTERELARPHFSDTAENTSLALRLDVHFSPQDGYYRDPPADSWFDENKLLELGFEVRDAKGNYWDNGRYWRYPRKAAWLVLEMDGKAHADNVAIIREQLAEAKAQDDAKSIKEIESTLRRQLQWSSRLYAIDAGLEPDALRATYPDRNRFAIVRGSVRMTAYGDKFTGLEIMGEVVDIDIDTINVPKHFRHLFKDLQRRPHQDHPTPRYEVSLSYGAYAEPWITAVTLQPDP